MKTNIELIHFLPRHVQKRGQYGDDWVAQHVSAINSPTLPQEAAIVSLVSGLLTYADYMEASGYLVSEDTYASDIWLGIATSIKKLLDGDVGRLDRGVLGDILYRVKARQGFTED